MSSYFISNYESEKHEQLSLQEKRALCENVKGDALSWLVGCFCASERDLCIRALL